MPRPRKPTEALILTGAFQKNPSRRRAIGPKSDAGLGEPPRHLTQAEADCWREAAANAPPGVLTSGDRWIVEVASRLMAKLRGAGVGGMRGAELSQLTGSLAKLGWTPSDRSRVALAADPAPVAADPWDTLAGSSG